MTNNFIECEVCHKFGIEVIGDRELTCEYCFGDMLDNADNEFIKTNEEKRGKD